MEKLQTHHQTDTAREPMKAHVFAAILQSPQEVTESFARLGLPVPSELKGYWNLCGHLDAATFDEVAGMEPTNPASQVTVLSTHAGGTYLVLTHQILTRQHRFVLPIWDAGVKLGVKALHEQRVRFMLARESGDVALVLPTLVNVSEIDDLLNYQGPSDPEALFPLIGEMPMVVDAVKQLGAVPSCSWLGAVKEVTVSAVVPVHAALSVVKGGGRPH